MKRVLPVILISLLLTGCYTSRFHYFGEVPKKQGDYPRFTAKDYQAGFLDEDRARYHVTFYNLDLTLNPDKQKISGEVSMHFRVVKTLKKLRFDLYRNLDIYTVKFQGKNLHFNRYKRAVYTVFPDSLEKGKDYSIEISYGGKPQVAAKPPWKGGLVWKRDKDNNYWIGVTCETEGASIWFPCKDHLSDEPDSVKLRMTVPSGLQVVSNGLMESHISEPGKEIFTWSTHYPINIYDITFYAAKYEHFSDTMSTKQGILSLDYYVLPENLERAKEHFKQVKDVIKIYSKSFGPYPWIKEGYKLVEGPFEGMEHQTAIAYGSGYSNMPWLGADYIIVHETAHEWWGNAVSVSDFSDIWLQEGFATYSEMIFVENKMGYDSSLVYARNWLAPLINNKLPVVGPRNVAYWDYKDVDVYNKGALILHTIRNIVNDSTLFFDILQTFYREHAASTHVTTADFREVVERKTGKDWSKFFEAYLYDRRVPVLHWYYGLYESDKNSENSVKTAIPFVVAKWANVPEGFSMPVTLDGKECNVSSTIQVTTTPTLFVLKELLPCKQLSYNLKHSYFDVSSDDSVLKEYEKLASGKK
jgi:aminopeptidase N